MSNDAIENKPDTSEAARQDEVRRMICLGVSKAEAIARVYNKPAESAKPKSSAANKPKPKS